MYMDFNVNRMNMNKNELELHKRMLRKKHNHNHYLRKKARTIEPTKTDSVKLDELLSIVNELKQRLDKEDKEPSDSESSDSESSDSESSDNESETKSKIQPPLYEEPIQFV